MLRQSITVSRRQLSTVTPLFNEATQKSKPPGSALFLGKTIDAFTPETEKLIINKRFQLNFEPGSTYEPFDFSMAKLHLEKKKVQEENKIQKAKYSKNINPLDFYTNPKYLSMFLSSTGKILHREVTRLSHKNQKRVTVAIKRARNAGLLSYVHKDVSLLSHRHGI